MFEHGTHCVHLEHILGILGGAGCKEQGALLTSRAAEEALSDSQWPEPPPLSPTHGVIPERPKEHQPGVCENRRC